MTDQPASLAEALALLQTRLPHIKKDSQAQYGKYADLADISKDLLPVMGELGLSFSAKPTWVIREDGTREFVLAYTLRHVSGDSDGGEYALGSKLDNQQSLGSAITYGRRYSLCAITGAVADEDDDGQSAPAPAPAAGRQPRGTPPVRAAANLPRNSKGQVARSQVTDEELADSGNMTAAEQKEHNKLEREVLGTDSQGKVKDPQSEHLTGTPPDDPFLAPPPAGLRTPRAAPPKAGVIHQHFGRLGYTDEDRDERLGVMTVITGRTIKSTNDLTAAEGIAVDKFIAACRDRDVLTDKLLDRFFMEPDDKRAVIEWRGPKLASSLAEFVGNARGDMEQARSDLWGRYRIHNKIAGIEG